MARYTVFITQVTKLAVEVEADNPADADTKAWDVSDDDRGVIDSDSTIEYMEDDQRQTWLPDRHGDYKLAWKRTEAGRRS